MPSAKDLLFGRSCECCGKSDSLNGVYASSFGPFSFLYCTPCTIAHAEPLFLYNYHKTVQKTYSLVHYCSHTDRYINLRTGLSIEFTHKDGTKIKTRKELTNKLKEENSAIS